MLEISGKIYLHGPGFAAWLDEQPAWRCGYCRLDELYKLRVRRWRRGTQASMGHVDEFLTELEINLSMVPEDLMGGYRNGRRKKAA
jgi:hypothetical protein